MKDETSIFGARPERLERLVFEALQDFESEEDASPTASLGAILEKPGGYIDRYKLINILGEGGMGIVYLAENGFPAIGVDRHPPFHNKSIHGPGRNISPEVVPGFHHFHTKKNQAGE